MKRLSVLFAALLLFTITSLAQNNIQLTIEGKVINVHDGDTVTVLDNDSKKFHIRLQGIDAPELKQQRGAESQKNLERMVLGKQVTIVWTKVDKYKRTVGTIVLNDRDVNIEQVRAGLAWHFKKYADEQQPLERELYAKAEEEARAAKKGLWQDENPTPPGDYRVAVKEARWGAPPPPGTIIGNKNSKKYHRPDCPGYKDMAEKNRVFFKSVEEAEAAGYQRAGNCPPEEMAATASSQKTPATQPKLPVAATTNVDPQLVKPVERPAPSTGEVIGNKNSKKYHLPNCPGYAQVSEKNRVPFKSAAEAEAAGYTLAGNCKADGQTSETKPKPATEAKTPDTPLAQPAPRTAATGEVIGNKNSKKYHLQGCPGYTQVGEKNRVYFKTAAEAEAAGYTKAGNCPK